MPMNPRLLRPRQTGGDPDALRYIAAVQAADGQPLEAGVRKAINDFVVGCKRDGIWSAIQFAALLSGPRTLSGALVPLRGAGITNSNFVTTDRDRKLGLLGGFNKRLSVAFPSAASQQANRHDSCYIMQPATAGGSATIYFATDVNPVTNCGIDTAANNGRLIFRSWNGSNGIINQFQHAGLVGISRTSLTTADVRVNGGTTSVSQGLTPISGTLTHWTNSGGFQHTATRFGFFSCGDSLDLALLDARVTSLINAIGAAIP